MPKFSGNCGCGRFNYDVPWRTVTAYPPNSPPPWQPSFQNLFAVGGYDE